MTDNRDIDEALRRAFTDEKATDSEMGRKLARMIGRAQAEGRRDKPSLLDRGRDLKDAIVIISAISAAVCAVVSAATYYVVNNHGAAWIRAAGIATAEDQAELRNLAEMNASQISRLSNLALDVAAVAKAIKTLDRRVTVLAAPPDVAEYHPDTRIEAPVTPGGEALFVAVVRRYRGALECNIIPESVEYHITSAADGIRRTTRLARKGSLRNLEESEYSTIELPIEVPRAIPPGEMCIEITTQYRDCQWQTEDGDPPVVQISPCVAGEIIP